MAESLILLGYSARVAYDAATALRVAAEFHPHVALLDDRPEAVGRRGGRARARAAQRLQEPRDLSRHLAHGDIARHELAKDLGAALDVTGALDDRGGLLLLVRARLRDGRHQLLRP